MSGAQDAQGEAPGVAASEGEAHDAAALQQDQRAPEGQAEGGAKGGEAKSAADAKDKPEREPWFVKRMAEQTREAHDLRRELEIKERRLRELEPQRQAEQDDPARAVEQRARQLVAEQQWNKDCNAMHAAGVAEFSDFGERMQTLARAGGIPNAVIEAAMETGEGHKVLYALGADPEQAMRIREMTPARMGVAMAKLAAQPAAAAPVTKAPAPLRTIGGGNVRSSDDPEKMSMAEFSAWRNKQEAARRAG